MNIISKVFLSFLFSICVMSAAGGSGSVQAASIHAVGATPAAIQSTVDTFRASLGANNGVGGHFTTGRREVNWDGVPDSSAMPNFMEPDFFNTTSRRGLVMNALEFESGTGVNNFLVSADSSNPTNTPVRFGDINTAYQSTFQSFSGQRIFHIRNTSTLEVLFFIPGTNIPATVNGFGVVFLDVDDNAGPETSSIRCYDAKGAQIIAAAPGVFNNGLSFVGLNFEPERPAARCAVEAGNARLGSNFNDIPNVTDVVAMDDFIYGEPQAAEYHSSDFDGDGTADRVVFRPSIGTWFVLNSGSNTINIQQFGANGDQPVEGDFDSDRRSDIAVYRPSTGAWFIQKSTDNSVMGVNFGSPGDKPSPGDYDKDGITDIAVFRPSNGSWLTLQSSNNFNINQFTVDQFGAAGDVTPQGAAQ